MNQPVVIGFLWKLATTIALVVSIFAIYDNGQRVRKLELQVCLTVYESFQAINNTQYYRIFEEEARRARERNLAIYRRFHCPPFKEVNGGK